MDSALRCPYKPFKLGLGGKQVTRCTRGGKNVMGFSVAQIIIVIIIIQKKQQPLFHLVTFSQVQT